jgi:hypothetical protein
MIPRSLLDDGKRQTFFSLEVEAADASETLKTVSDTTCCRNLDDYSHISTATTTFTVTGFCL